VILDSSAVVSMLLREHGHEALEQKMRTVARVGIGAPTLAETKRVMVRRRGTPGVTSVDLLLAFLKVEILPFEGEHAFVAGDAAIRFGKGRHPAKLNYGGVHDLRDGAHRRRAVALHRQ
jgi:ribonuclease VapC